jgi:hypothetical protein
MYNKGKVVFGLLVFIALATFPIWRNSFFVSAQNREIPKPVINPALPVDAACVEDRNYMRVKHMVLLNNWRNEVVRENKKVYINSKGECFNKSLTGTCLNCHSNKEEFCDNCHKSVGVHPYCFDCHISGAEIKGNPHER